MLPNLVSRNLCFVRNYNRSIRHSYHTTLVLAAGGKPLKRKTSSSQIDSYPSVNVYCTTCNLHIFRYKKKNGTKSNLVKCYIERVIEDCAFLLRDQYYAISSNSDGQINRDEPHEETYICPKCHTAIARYAMVRGLPSLKWVGGKIRMSKK